jgi:drug/metabolite transporter (DMT)-like permease
MITLSSVAPFAMVFNSILATTILKEKFTKHDLASIFLISVGASICVIFSNYKSFELTIQVSSASIDFFKLFIKTMFYRTSLIW